MRKQMNRKKTSSPEERAGGVDDGKENGDDKFEAFERWLRANGAQFPLLELRQYDSPSSSSGGVDGGDYDDENEEKKDGTPDDAMPDGDGDAEGTRGDDGSGEMRGVHARTAIPPQTVCVSIPRSCLITVEMGQATPIGRRVLASDLELDAPKHIFLMIYLLWDKKVHGRRSFFWPYYDILPKTLRNMPIFWTDHELRLLTGSHLLSQIADRRSAIREDYNSICSVCPEFPQIASLRDFEWARMIVCSRNFGLLIDGARTSALVPHADMLNHLRPRETKWTYCDETRCFTITTLQSIARGSQVYDSYGQKCNHRFLLNYGFCVERNVEVDGFCPNEVPVEVGMNLCGVGKRNSEGGEISDEGDEDRELYDRKLAFWIRGDAALPAMDAGPFDPSSSIGCGLGSSFQALRAAVSGTSSGGSDEIIRNIQSMAAMGDSETASALNEAVAGVASNEIGDSASASAPMAMSMPGRLRLPAPIKRVRVCVSNNENTRSLFSMLRVLACDSGELDRIVGVAGRHSALPSFSGTYNSGGGVTAAQRLFGLPPSAVGPPGDLTPLPRSCRDVRYPISLRNERRAMELLLEVTRRGLSGYPTSLAQDIRDLADEVALPRYSNARNARLQVRGEKEVLNHFALWSRTAMHVIDVIAREVETEKRLIRASAAGGSAAIDGLGLGLGDDLGFERVIRAMEDDDDCHTTILRYCSDVLGAARRDELSRLANGMF